MKPTMSLYEAIEVGHEICKQVGIKHVTNRTFTFVDEAVRDEVAGACAVGMALIAEGYNPSRELFPISEAADLWGVVVDRVITENDTVGLNAAKRAALSYLSHSH